MSVQLRSAEVARWHSFILSNLIFSGSASRPMKPGFGGMFVVVLGRQSWLVLRLHDLVFQRLLLFHFLNIILSSLAWRDFHSVAKVAINTPVSTLGQYLLESNIQAHTSVGQHLLCFGFLYSQNMVIMLLF